MSWPYMYYCQATMLVIVINCLRLFVVVIYCYHGDGSDGRHVCTKYHGHTYYYQATMLEIVINCLRLFVVVIMAMQGGMFVQSITATIQSITAIHTTISYVGNGVL